MIRTRIIELTTIPALAYRQKLTSGGAGLTLIRFDEKQPALAVIDRRSGAPVVRQPVNAEKFPEAAFAEALEMTRGLPYGKRGAVTLASKPEFLEGPEEMPESSETPEESTVAPEAALAAVCSKEYQTIVDKFTDDRGLLSYKLINRDFIQFARRSRVVANMAGEGATVEELRDYVVRSRFGAITKNRNLTPGQVEAMSQMLDGVSEKYVYRELTEELTRSLGKGKR
ncbi:MAG: hypothetical protein FWD16_03440 [Clostridia bacterium]|nr:hypothetical protein [Clostridia bacterium]